MAIYPRKIAVLTGDFVRSTDMSERDIDRAMTALAAFVQAQSTWLGEAFTRQSGDGWQMVVPHPENALRAALAMRAKLRSLGANFDTYVSIAVGDLDQAPPQDLNLTNNTLFISSGRDLGRLKDRARSDGIMMAHWDMGLAAATTVLADHISQGWTPAQAQAMALFLLPDSDDLSYTDAAERLGKSRQAVTKSLKGAGRDSIIRSLILLETALKAQYHGTQDA